MSSSSGRIQLQTLILILFFWSTSFGSPIVSDGISESGSHGDASCPAGWRRWKDEKCILYHSSDVDYETAEGNCQSIGARLVTITSAEEEDFVISLLKQEKEASAITAAAPAATSSGRSNAFYFWIDSTSTVRGIPSSISSSSPLGTSTTGSGISSSPTSGRCPIPAKSSTTGDNGALCPAQVVRISGKKKTFWCYFDCNKQEVDAICEMIIRRKGEEPGAKSGIQSLIPNSRKKTTTRKRDISSSSENNQNSLLIPSLRTSSSPPPPAAESVVPTSSFPPSPASVPASATSSPPSLSSLSDLTTASALVTSPAADADAAAFDCEVGWKLHDDKCYKSIQMDTNGQEAKNLCQFRDSAHLTSITSSGVQQAIGTLVSGAKEPFNRPLLIDGRYDRETRTFHWSEGDIAFRYTNWGPGQPDLFDEGDICVAIDTDKKSLPPASWITIPCNQTANLLCSKPGRRRETAITETSDAVSTSNTHLIPGTSTSTPSPASSSSPVDPVAASASVTASPAVPCPGSEEEEQQEVTFDPAIMRRRCNESVDNGKEGKASASPAAEASGVKGSTTASGKDDGIDDDRRAKMVDHSRQVMSGIRDGDGGESSRASAASGAAGGKEEEERETTPDDDERPAEKKSAERESGGKQGNTSGGLLASGSGAKTVIGSSSSSNSREGADAAIIDVDRSNNNKDMRTGEKRGLTAGGSLTLSILIIVLAGILLTVCFLVRIRDKRRRRNGGSGGGSAGNSSKVISLQRSQHDSNIYFDKSPVTIIDTAVHDEDDADPDVALFDKSSFTNNSKS